MKKVRYISAIFAIVFFFLSDARGAEVKARLCGYLQNLIIYKTDSDFDSSRPYYKPAGQSVGYAGTFFNPKFSLLVGEDLRVYWEAELGLNIWSRNTAEAFSYSEKGLVLKHRQIYAEVKADEYLWIRAGYQYVADPTGLFLNHWLGAVRVRINLSERPIEFFAGQLPDQNYESANLDFNNFRHDIFPWGVSTTFSGVKGWTIQAGLYGLYDAEVIIRHTWLFTPVVHITRSQEFSTFGADLALQVGWTNRGAWDGSDERHTAGALQIYYMYGAARTAWGKYVDGRVVPGLAGAEESGNFGWSMSLLVLSPDDTHERSGENYAFLYSGRSLSRTLVFTEDELRDRGDNLDERTSQRVGAFFRSRTGFLLADAGIYYYPRPRLLLMGIAGAGMALNNNNARGKWFTGVEIDGALRYQLSPHLVVDVVNTFFVPGGVAAAFVNTINPDSTRPLYMLEVSLNAFF